jgi:ubiquinone/menaquinone biosynthesis C-methylase UbiE
VARHVRLGEFLVGVAGLGLIRHVFTGDDAAASARVDEIRGIVCGDDEVYDLGVDVPVLDAKSGYARWAETYDLPGNPLISVEQPLVWAMLERLPPGDALDAACGTGRHAKYLADLGHRVVGVDGSPDMLAKAKFDVPAAEFREGELTALPFDDNRFDIAVCALALEHVADLDAAIAELARVVRPSGRIIVSDLHPAAVVAGGAAYFQDAAGGAGVVRGYGHLHGDYLRAFRRVGLQVEQCLEPLIGDAEVAMQGPAATFIPAAARAAYFGLPMALIWELRAP